MRFHFSRYTEVYDDMTRSFVVVPTSSFAKESTKSDGARLRELQDRAQSTLTKLLDKRCNGRVRVTRSFDPPKKWSETLDMMDPDW